MSQKHKDFLFSGVVFLMSLAVTACHILKFHRGGGLYEVAPGIADLIFAILIFPVVTKPYRIWKVAAMLLMSLSYSVTHLILNLHNGKGWWSLFTLLPFVIVTAILARNTTVTKVDADGEEV